MSQLGLFRDALNLNAIGLDHSIGDAELILTNRDRKFGIILTMKIEHCLEIHARKNIAIYYEQGLAGRLK